MRSLVWFVCGLPAIAGCDVGDRSTGHGGSSSGTTSMSTSASTSADGGTYSTWTCLTAYVTPTTRDPGVWPFSASSPWNAPLGAGAQFEQATDACTQDILAMPMGTSINSHAWSHPVYLAATTDPEVNLYQSQKLVDPMIHCPAGAAPALPPPPNTDAHLHIVDPAHTSLDEMWEASKVSDGWTSQAWAKTDLLGPGVGQGGVRAYGGSAIGGLIRSGELTGVIRHPLAFAIPQAQQKDSWVWPATINDGFAASGYTGHVPMGQLAGIPPGVDLCSLGLSPGGLVIARALQDYGAYVVDSAGDLAFYAQTQVEDDPLPGELAALAAARGDIAKIVAQMRCVTNNAEATPGGGGAPRAPAAPPVP
jgi:hypothetical protein